ncbi:hypothetical protein [Acinetobacter terrae]|jgi:hypothetical protein|uniref:Uncharacterized protein n=1 Tax=Acinetobacter terrae TaxID=2731247 RepID=A0A241VIM7_9GAMM|nr:hypothetical protein [Acinetobacter terrae]NNG77116.1 hypothetical protein [Acinetobacter terrae]NNH16402.1 hypothetical protein [Acinetobacter terrae]NNH39490.1 hypothetical protein [Acinetobacter terrae]NNH79038.1 hypothetical protein [Acinetobacter terrae]NNH87523.1 hypothetical protein [Acinetobacter terrae]
MTQMIEVKVKDQFSKVHEVHALLRDLPENAESNKLSIFQRIEHIVVDGEMIQPSIELLFESRNSDSIYRIIE